MRMPFPLLAGAALFAGACSDSTGPNTTVQPPATTASVEVQDDQFVNASVRILPGGTVTWTWRGDRDHNVTFTGGPSSSTQAGGSFQRTFETPGSYPYRCTVHGQSMSGTVTVVVRPDTT